MTDKAGQRQKNGGKTASKHGQPTDKVEFGQNLDKKV